MVVAQRDIVWDSINVVRRAGLRVRAVDSSPLAMLRAVPAPAEGQDLEAVVSIGSQLVVVAIREGHAPVRSHRRHHDTHYGGNVQPAWPHWRWRFWRRTICAEDGCSEDGCSEDGCSGDGCSGDGCSGGGFPDEWLASELLSQSATHIVEEVRGSLEYLVRSQGVRLSGIWLTGGGALIPGVSERIGAAVGASVRTATVGAQHTPEGLDLSEAQERAASARWCTAVGLALWGTGGLPAPSLLPPEIKERARRQQAMAGAGAGVLALCVALGAASANKVESISGLNNRCLARPN